jgi:hypothetical protein
MSQFFTATIGVIQGGVVSPILFCVYIDDLLLDQCSILRQRQQIPEVEWSGVIAYADDIVFICPTPSVIRKLLRICDTCASNIVFKADKSKFLIVVPARWRNLCGTSISVFISGINLLQKLLHTHVLGVALVPTCMTLLMLCTGVAIS